MERAKEVPTVVRIRLVTDAEMRDPTLRTFRSLIGQLRGQPGCLSCQLLEDVQEPGDLTLIQKWHTQKGLERFVRSRGFARLMTSLDLAAQPPEVEIQTPGGSRGIDFFEEVLAISGSHSATDSPETD